MDPNPKHVHDIHIKAASNRGFIMTVGCAQIVINDNLHDISRALDDLRDYLLNPQAVEREWNRKRSSAEQVAYGLSGGCNTAAPPELRETEERSL